MNARRGRVAHAREMSKTNERIRCAEGTGATASDWGWPRPTQAPGVFACFIASVARAPNLAAPHFKHLRDVLGSAIDRKAFARGRRAQPLFTFDLEACAGESAVHVRRRLEIEPRSARPSGGDLDNTCGGKRMPPYFTRHA
jgi:hypothetical protein